MKRFLTNGALAITILAAPAAIRAQMGYASADTMISSANPSTNFGNVPEIAVGGGNSMLVNFNWPPAPVVQYSQTYDVSTACPAPPCTTGYATPSTVPVNARVTFFVNKVLVAGTLRIAPITSGWSESAVTYNTQPPVSSGGQTVSVSASSTFISVDITSLFALSNYYGIPPSGPYYGFEISADSSAPATSVIIDSKESTTTAHPAFAQVAYSPLVTLYATQTITCTDTLNDCPYSLWLVATCPANMVRVAVLNCRQPDSLNLSATINPNGYQTQYNAYAGACGYMGAVNKGSNTTGASCYTDIVLTGDLRAATNVAPGRAAPRRRPPRRRLSAVLHVPADGRVGPGHRQHGARVEFALSFSTRAGSLPRPALHQEEDKMRRFLTNGALAITILAAPAAIRAQTGYASADTMISSANASTNFGNLPSIAVGGGNSMLVNFNWPPIPANLYETQYDASSGCATLPCTMAVESYNVPVNARVTFFVNKVLVAGTLRIAPITSGWSESAVTYNTQPSVSSGGQTVSVSASSTFISVDITSLFVPFSGGPGYGFEISADSSAPATSVIIDSKESTTTKHPAFAEVAYSPLVVLFAIQTISCTNTNATCPTDVSLVATCPANMVRVAVLSCQKPFATSITVVIDPNDSQVQYNAYAGACHYTGALPASTNGFPLMTQILCSPGVFTVPPQ